jgi:DAK2 domain fusion protein YloV
MSYLRGDDLRQAFFAGTQCLERYRDAINALNVFPVPDGDTGTNMLLTMRSAMERCPETCGASAADVSSGLAEGAFWGARGNSGVILSQLFRGFAEALPEAEVCNGPDLAQALSLATAAAYASVARPVEGTMLTVLRSASVSVQEMSEGEKDPGVLALWETAFSSAVEALYRTPSQLPVLKEAGVVDAGGMGVAIIMGGALCYLTGREQDLVDQAVAACCIEPTSFGGVKSSIDSDYLDSTLESQWGYCIQFLVKGEGLALESIREHLGKEWADSAVAVGDDRLVRVHVHSGDPGPALSYGASIGDLYQIRIENMSQQNQEFVTGHRDKETELADLAVVAVVQGSGLAQLFRDVGCSLVINGGQTMNPSVGQFLDAAQATGAKEIIVLPNNPNVEATALQSAGANPRLHVVPSRTLPQGVCALLAFNPEEPLERNLKSMQDTLSSVVTFEVTQAVRSSTIAGIRVNAGQYISLLEGKLASAADTPEKALRSALEGVHHSADQIVTIYQGEDALPGAADELCRQLEEEIPGVQVDLVYGGQPHYHYLASVE